MKTRNAVVVNCSLGRRGAPLYNLGARKLYDHLLQQGYSTQYHDGDPGLFALDADLVCLSVIFSWDAQLARKIAIRCADNCEVWSGGPGLFALKGWWKRETGLDCHVGLDSRFDRQRGNYEMTFASRGCPVGCGFCIVWHIEGKQQTLDFDFIPAPILADNNLSALPFEFQQHIVNKYVASGMFVEDAMSGFEPATFTRECYDLWGKVLRGPWRFAFDEHGEVDEVYRMMEILKGVNPVKKRCYVLIGNEPMESCFERALKVIEWGGEPFCQPMIPLNALSRKHLKIAYDWNYTKLTDFARFFNRYLWRSMKLSEYNPRNEREGSFGKYKWASVLAGRTKTNT